MALGTEQNTNDINEPGFYKDPQSGEVLEVMHEAGADALVRLGWKKIDEPKTVVESKK